MPYDKNHCSFSGKIIEIKSIRTRTGTPMISLKLQCWKEQIRVIAFNDLAETVLQSLKSGDRIEVIGKLQTSTWEHEGVRRYGFQIVADELRDEQESKAPTFPGDEPPAPNEPDPVEGQGDDHQYHGGPF